MTATTSPLGTRTVNRIGLGAMQLTGPGVLGPPDDPDACRAVLRRAVDLGVDHIDTAQPYGPDVANALIAEALHPYPEGLLIATKVGGTRDERGGWVRASRPEQLRALVEHDLRCLRLERIGLVHLRLGVGGPEPDPVPLADQLGVLTELHAEGKVDLIGLSNASVEVVAEAIDLAPIAAVQNPFGLLDRTDQPVLDLCRQHGVAYVPFYPLGSAFTGGPSALAADEAVATVAAKHAASPAQVALAWLLAIYERMLPIPGTRSVAHLEENLAATALTLDEHDLATLDG